MEEKILKTLEETSREISEIKKIVNNGKPIIVLGYFTIIYSIILLFASIILLIVGITENNEEPLEYEINCIIDRINYQNFYILPKEYDALIYTDIIVDLHLFNCLKEGDQISIKIEKSNYQILNSNSYAKVLVNSISYNQKIVSEKDILEETNPFLPVIIIFPIGAGLFVLGYFLIKKGKKLK